MNTKNLIKDQSFFSWNRLWKQYPQFKNEILQCAITPRNVGKTTDTYKWLMDNGGFTEEKKVVLLRNTDTEVKVMKADFNSRFAGKFIAYGNHIYKLEQVLTIDKKGKEIANFAKKEVVGYIASINNYTVIKSVEAKNIWCFFYEEFNEDTIIGRNIYPKFINILTTFARFNDIKYFFMIGNKDGFDSDFFINWNILPSGNLEDKITPIVNKQKDVLGVVYDLGPYMFKGLKNNETFAYKLGLLDNRSKAYVEGMYLQGYSSQVKHYENLLEDFREEFILCLKENSYVVGKSSCGVYKLLSPWNYTPQEKLKRYALDNLSSVVVNNDLLEKEDIKEIMLFIFTNLRTNNIFFDSYDSLQNIRDFASRYYGIM